MAERRIIRGALVLALDGRRTARRADILVEEGVVRATGGVDTEAALLTDVRGLVLPGLVQAHLDLSGALLDRGFVPHVDMRTVLSVQVEAWRANLGDAARAVSVRSGIARGIAAGASTFGDTGCVSPDILMEAAGSFGARAVISLPAEGPVESELARLAAGLDGRIRSGISLITSRVGRGRMRSIRAIAERTGAPVLCSAWTDPGVFRRLESVGLLGPSVSIAGLDGVTAREADALAQSGTTVILTPGLSLLFGAPPPPIDLLMERGVRLALSSASNATRLGHDLFAEARLVMRFLEGKLDQAGSAVLEMVSPNGARALGFDGGTIEVGKPADFVLLDVDADAHEAYETTCRRIIDKAGPSAVRTVWVGGQVVCADGKPSLASPPNHEEEASVRSAVVPIVEREVARPTMARAFRFATRSLWRSRGWRI
jgi:cytosine/adenosine deaminase-related metal-dependent hydrolase